MSGSAFIITPGQRFNPFRQFHGVFLPNALLSYTGLSSNSKLVWGRLGQYAGENGECYPSYASLADELGISRRTAIRSVAELVEAGFLEKENSETDEHWDRRTNRYYFLLHPVLCSSLRSGGGNGGNGDKKSPPRGQVGTPPVTGCHPDGDKMSPEEIHEKTTEGEPTTTPAVGGGEPLPERAEDYIRLKMIVEMARGRIRVSPLAYRRRLEGLAREGKLCMDDMGELQAYLQKREEMARRLEQEKAERQSRIEEDERTRESNRERVASQIAQSGDSPEVWAQRLRDEQNKPLMSRAKFFGLPWAPAWSHFRELYPALTSEEAVIGCPKDSRNEGAEGGTRDDGSEA